MTNEASKAQISAADPRFSTWLSANAGSGKTRVLTDRVARLLLAGTEPQQILCLTYTKAAASEMQNRLFKRLGAWAMMADDDLRQTLVELGETPPASLEHARTLFARAIDAPGGLKIQTIHSFCSSILRQFPVEAGVSPQFRELDEAGQRSLADDVIDQLAATDNAALGPIARIVSDESLSDVALAIAANRHKFRPSLSRSDIFAMFGAQQDRTVSDIVRGAVASEDIIFLKAIAPILTASDGVQDRKLGTALASLPNDPSLAALLELESRFIFKSGERAGQPRIGASPPSKGLRDGPLRSHIDRLEEIMERVAQARTQRLAQEAATRTAALHGFAQAFLSAYGDMKDALGLLDFDDLIEKAGNLLTAQSLEWVLYRLDGGIDHILVDEAQDTSPRQWDVIDALAREITSGKGAREDRTLFVVGDKKQSIYSFQGADAREFDRMHEVFNERLKSGSALQSRELHYSFRSSTAILAVVDAVFEGARGRGLGHDMAHRAFHADQPGRVDLWPLVPAIEQAATPEWYDPVDRIAANDPRITLADAIAKNIAKMVRTETITGENGQSRLVTYGDFLILVQSRGALFEHIIRACKSRDLPIAGADRLKIRGELAVRDLLALLAFLALQEDSLSLATALRSPLFSWTEKQLYNLAQGRKQPYLWAELRDRREEFPETYAELNALLRHVDFLRPYELLESILTRHNGRRKLLARLGPEAEDGIDELLNQALAYETGAIPSLTGFLAHAQSEDVEIKRQLDGSGDLIRVMTVHGAKGLESPIVILPDTTRRENPQRDPILMSQDDMPVWRMPASDRPEQLAAAVDAAADANRQERQRLLYVAMTRAESWLIVCGTEAGNARSNWYNDVAAAFDILDAEPLDTPTGQGARITHGKWPDVPGGQKTKTVSKKREIPVFLSQVAEKPSSHTKALNPSDLGGAKALPGGAKDEETALRYGRQVHRLLELLPSTDRSPEAAHRILASGPDPLDDDIAPMLAEARGVIDRFPDLFQRGILAEVDVAAHLPTLDLPMSGTIDRLIVTPEKVVAIDFKTNETTPESPETVPEGILRQMGAYLEALEQIYPEREIELAILWTASAEMTRLPHGIVRQALARYTTS